MKRFLLYIFIGFFALIYFNCAYFNTFYYTKKHFNQGLKAIEKEEKGVQLNTNRANPSSRRGRSTPARSRPTTSTQIRQGSAAQRSQDESLSKEKLYASAQPSFTRCIEMGSKLLENYPKCKWVDDTLYLLGRSFYYRQEYDEASEKFQELITLFPESRFIPEARLWWGKSNIQMSSFTNAETNFREVLDLNCKQDVKNQARFGLADLLYVQERFEMSVEAYEDLVENVNKKELQTKAQLRIADCYYRMEDYENAAESFYKAKKFAKTHEQKYQSEFRYGVCKKIIGDYDEAIKIFMKLLDDGKNVNHFAELRIEYAGSLKGKKEFDEATDIYKDIGNIYPKTTYASEAYYNIGLIYYKEYLDFAEADTNFKESVKTFPSSIYSEMSKEISNDIMMLNKLGLSIANEKKNEKKNEIKDVNTQGDTLQIADRKAPSDTLQIADRKARLERLKMIDEQAKNRYLLGEIFLNKIEKVDSAAFYFNDIKDNFIESSFASKSILQLYNIYNNNLNEKEKAKGLLEEFLEKYPQDDLSNSVREKLDIPTILLQKDSLTAEVKIAEDLYFNKKQFDEAIEKYQKIYSNFPEFELAPKCIYINGWHYENEELNIEKAVEKYKKLIEDYPESEYAKKVVLKVNEYEKEMEKRKKEEEAEKKERIKKEEQKAKETETAENKEETQKDEQRKMLQEELKKKREMIEKKKDK